MSSKPQIRSLKKKPNPAATTTATEITAASDKGTQPDTLKPAAIPSYTTTKTFPNPVPATLPVTELAPKTLTIANTENKTLTASSAQSTPNTQTAPLAQSDTETVILTESEAIPETDKPFFQAIGTLHGTVEKNSEDIFFIKLGGKPYRLFIPGYRYAAFKKQQENNPDIPLYLRVYPKCLIIPRKEQRVYFQVAAWSENNSWEEEPGIFRVRGLWQFVPQLRTPVISIYRNSKATDPTGKFKAAHIPVLMRRDDEANPFKFNPKIAKEDLPPRWFIQANFRFMTSRDCWGWVEDLEPPTLDIPWYKKPRKEVTGTEPVRSSKKPEQPTKNSQNVIS